MAGFSNYLEDKILDEAFRNVGYTPAATVYVALFTAISNAEAGTGTEASYGAYARVAVTFGASSGGAISNSGNVDFAAKSDAGTATITHAGIFDDPTAGNALTALTALAASVALSQGDILRFPTGDIDITLD